MHRVLQFGLLGVQHLAHRPHLSGGLRLQPRDLVHALIGELGALALGFRRAAARAHDQENDQQQAARQQQSATRAAAMPASTSGSIWARRAEIVFRSIRRF